MKEAFVQFVWQHKLLQVGNFTTVMGTSLSVTNYGILNHDSGPDFLNAQLFMDGQTWAGAIEIHIKASAWKLHKHTNDKNYNNVILHVVWEFDGYHALRHDGTVIPTLEIKQLVDENLLQNYQQLSEQLNLVACHKHPVKTYEVQMQSAYHRALADRLILKSEKIMDLAMQTKFDWQNVFYITTSRYLGMKVNTQPMEDLAKRTPNELLAKNRHNFLLLEALLFGQAGFLDSPAIDEYHGKLKEEYNFLKNKYTLQSMSVLEWKFGKLRPPNFPTLRIAQLAALVYSQWHLFSKIIEIKNIAQLKKEFNSQPSNYWLNHYKFGNETTKKVGSLGETSIYSILINVVSPILFAYGKYKNQENLVQRAFDLLELLPAEDNKFTRHYNTLGFANNNAYDSQAILGLKENYCEPKQCLKCAIGVKVLSRKY